MTINRTNISMTRGDSETLTVSLSNGVFNAGDTVTLTVRPDVEDPIVLQKVVTEFFDGAAIFILVPNDTEGLEFGDYVYDIQLTRADGYVTTLVKPSQFTLEEEVTY